MEMTFDHNDVGRYLSPDMDYVALDNEFAILLGGSLDRPELGGNEGTGIGDDIY